MAKYVWQPFTIGGLGFEVRARDESQQPGEPVEASFLIGRWLKCPVPVPWVRRAEALDIDDVPELEPLVDTLSDARVRP